MLDLLLGVLMVWVLAAGAAAGVWRLSREAPVWKLNLAALLTVGLLLAYLYWLQDSALLAVLLPTSAVLTLGRWHLIFAAVLATLLCRRLEKAKWRKRLTVTALLAIGLYGAYGSFLHPRPALVTTVWDAGVCIQSSPSSCSAAAAVTLLAEHNIESTEAETARLALTSKAGTSFHGLVRALRIKTSGTPWRTVAFSATGIGGLKKRTRSQPAIIWVRLDEAPGIDPRYARDWGWVPGRAHAVVVFGFDGERVEIGDPSVGREYWHTQGLRDLWHGEGVLLLPRDETAP